MAIDLTSFSLLIGRPANDVEPWFTPVLNNGRGAAFVDTGFLRALLDDQDQYAAVARMQFESLEGTNIYTTTLVLAEVVRFIAKSKHVEEARKRRMIDDCMLLLVEPGRVVLCSPPVELTKDAYRSLCNLRNHYTSLDLCDMVSLSVLQYARHRRVLGFDHDHFETCGAALEP